MKKVLAIACGIALMALGAGLLAFVAVAAAGFSSTATPPPNHHVHDCTLPPGSCVYPHLAVGFFPKILDEPLSTYLEDPAQCNDATDKSLLPGDPKPEGNSPLRAGVCYTTTTIIHLRSIDVGDPAPSGWSGPIAPVTVDGVTYVTYWLLTPS
jgi:hypothetical protein